MMIQNSNLLSLTLDDGEVTMVEPELGALLGVFALNGFIESRTDELNSKVDLPYLERKIVFWLDQPKRLGTLAREMNVLPSTMTAAADQLELRGMVVRERDPNDRRAWLLHLTQDGKEHRNTMVTLARSLLCDTLNLTEEEVRSFAEISLKIYSKTKKHSNC